MEKRLVVNFMFDEGLLRAPVSSSNDLFLIHMYILMSNDCLRKILEHVGHSANVQRPAHGGGQLDF